MGIITVVLPVFVIIILGWLFKTWNLIKQDASKHFISFIRMIAAPALLLLSLGSTSFDNIWNWTFVGTLGIPVLVLFVVSIYVLRIIMRKQTASAALTSLAISTSNIAYIGLPLLYGIFGRRAMVPAALAILMQMVLVLLAIFFLEMSSGSKSNVVGSFKKAARVAIFNPFTIAIVIGFLYSLTGLQIPSGIAKFLHVLEIAIVPLALFTVGLQIDPAEFGKRFQSSFIIWAIKLVILPAVVLWIVNSFFITPMWAIVAVVVAGLPYNSAVAHIGPKYTKEKGGKVSHLWGGTRDTTVLISLVSLFIWFIILFQMYPGEFRSTLAFF